MSDKEIKTFALGEPLVDYINSIGIPDYVKNRYGFNSVEVMASYGPCWVLPENNPTNRKWVSGSGDTTFQMSASLVPSAKDLNEAIYKGVELHGNVMKSSGFKDIIIFVYMLAVAIDKNKTDIQIDRKLSDEGAYTIPKYEHSALFRFAFAGNVETRIPVL